MVYPATLGPENPLRKALENQTSIGWYNLFLGRASKLFAPIQTKYYKQLGRKSTGDMWTSKLIVRLWDILWAHWEHRNGILHSPDHPWKLAEKQSLWQNIQEMRELGYDALLPQHQYLLKYSEPRMQAWTQDQQKQWLDSIQSARAVFRHQQEQINPPSTALDTWLQQDLEDSSNPDSTPASNLHDDLDEAAFQHFLDAMEDNEDDPDSATTPPLPHPDLPFDLPERLYPAPSSKKRRSKRDKAQQSMDQQRQAMTDFLRLANPL